MHFSWIYIWCLVTNFYWHCSFVEAFSNEQLNSNCKPTFVLSNKTNERTKCPATALLPARCEITRHSDLMWALVWYSVPGLCSGHVSSSVTRHSHKSLICYRHHSLSGHTYSDEAESRSGWQNVMQIYFVVWNYFAISRPHSVELE